MKGHKEVEVKTTKKNIIRFESPKMKVSSSKEVQPHSPFPNHIENEPGKRKKEEPKGSQN